MTSQVGKKLSQYLHHKNNWLQGIGSTIISAIFLRPIARNISRMDTGRKSRSLEALAKKIVAKCPEHVESNEIVLLNVDDIRDFFQLKTNGCVYDVLSILESLFLVTKTCRKSYTWNGFGHLSKTMALFKMIAVKLNFADDINKAKALQGQRLLNSDYESLPQSLAMMLPEVVKPANIPRRGQMSKSSHYLELAHRFLMLVTIIPPGETISISTCRIAIFNESDDRRLQDITNVLSCIPHPVITKVCASYSNKRKKNIYYSGPDVANTSLTLEEINSLPEYRRGSMISVGLQALDITERKSYLPGLISNFLVYEQNDTADDLDEDDRDDSVNSNPTTSDP